MRVRLGDGARLFVDVDGPGLVPDGSEMRQRPTVLLLHGGPGMDHSMFKTEAFRRLRDVGQVLYLDQRGQGRSDRRQPSEWNLDRWADDVVAVCDVLGVTAPVVVGTSFGGFVAQRYLARHPRHAGAAVIAGSSPRLDLDTVGASFSRLGGDRAGALARRFLSGDFEAADEFNAVCLPLYATQPLDLEMLARVEMNPDVLAHFMGEWNSMDLRDGLSDVACPVVVLAGELDPIAPPDAVTELADALPGDRTDYRVVPGAGHFEVCAEATAHAASHLVSIGAD